MKKLKITGVIDVCDNISLQQFCEMFNEVMDKYNFGFSGVIKEEEEGIG